jgi:hypothetical protein
MALIQTQFIEIGIVAADIDDDSVLAQQQGDGGFLYEQVTGDLLKKIIIAMNKDVRLLSNVGLSVVANTPTNGLTIALKQADGTDPGPLHKNKVVAEFRSATLASGSVVFREVTAALSSVITSGSTLGFFAAKAEKIHIYLIDDSGTVRIAYSGSDTFDEAALQTTVAEGGAGAADSKAALYADAVYANVAIRYLGYALLTQATPGTWVTNPTQIVVGKPARGQVENGVVASTGNGRGSTDTLIRRITNTTNIGPGTAVTHATSAANGSTFTINEDGLYSIEYSDGDSAAVITIGVSLNSNQLTTAIASITAANRLQFKRVDTSGGASVDVLAIVRRLKVGDIIRPHLNSATSGDATTHCFFIVRKIGD